MEELNLVVTDIGLAKIAGATVEEPLILEKFAVGDGNGSEIVLDPARRDLVNEKYRDLLNNKYSNNNNIIIECVLRANAPITEGFYLRELGVFDIDGDLIAHAKLPEQYRPPLETGQIVTENIFNINLKIQNTENIQVFIEETVFATEDSVQRLLERVEALENTNIALMKSKVGIDTWFNTNNSYKGTKLLTVGIQTWALMEEGNILSIADYQEMFKNCGAVDRGDGTFQVPIVHPDSTIKNLKSDNTRELGSYEADATKSHVHGMADIKGEMLSIWGDKSANGAFKNSSRFWGSNGNWESVPWKGGQEASTYWYHNTTKFSSHDAGVTQTNAAGGAETIMKNTAGQWYVLAKINI